MIKKGENMKKLIFLLILLSSSLYPIDIIDLNMTVEMGIIPGGTFKTYDFTRRIYDKLSFYGDFKFETQMFDNHLFFGIGSKIYMWKVRESKSFKPDSINFLFFAGIRINESVEIGWRHYCDHPIKSWDNGSNTNLERWYEEAYIKLNFTLFE